MRRGIAGLLCGAFFAGALLCGDPAFAATQSAQPGVPPKPPQVARISVIEGGDVVVQRGDSKKQVEAAVNAPLLPGDFVTTGAGARAEVQFDGFTMLRLAQNVQARIVASDTHSHQLQLAQGTIEVAILHVDGASTTIETPSATIRVTEPSDVRVSVDADGTTSATARTGSAALETPQESYDLESGITFVASGDAAHPAVTQTEAAAFDAFDDFNAERDKKIYVALNADNDEPPSVAGYDNLSLYGKWVDVQPYGDVWVPNGVASDWAPYRDGQWTWTDGYGWTWVSNEAWGWVPYHYGRWFYQSGIGWCWDPPEAETLPDWSPALVSFFGWGSASSGWGSFGFGNVGWVPLAPNEIYYPWYTYNPWQGYNPPPHTKPTPPPYHGVVHRNPPVVRPRPRNLDAGGASGVDAASFHAGNFSRATAVDSTRIVNPTFLREGSSLAPSPENYTFTRTPLKAPVTISQSFSQPRFTAPIAHVPASSEPSPWSRFDSSRAALPASAPDRPLPANIRSGSGSFDRLDPFRPAPSTHSQPAHSAPASAPARPAPAQPSHTSDSHTHPPHG
jgi:hypothetical protein